VETLLYVIPLGIGAAFTPSLLALSILVSGQDQWRKRAAALAAGSILAFGLFGVLIIFGFRKLPLPEVDGSDWFGALVRLLAAAVLAVSAIYLFIPHPALQKRVESRIQSYVQNSSLVMMFAIAFLLSIKDVSSFVMLVPALHDIAVCPNFIEAGVALVVLYTLALSPVLAPIAVRLFFDKGSRDPMQKLYRFTMDHQFQIVGFVAVILSAYLAVTGWHQLP
jgi:hypothetical protein